jgi:hypothetical protein
MRYLQHVVRCRVAHLRSKHTVALIAAHRAVRAAPSMHHNINTAALRYLNLLQQDYAGMMLY